MVAAADYPPATARSARPVGYWLLLMALLVFAMAIIGAVTRLTESGLSITEWNLVMGALPPMTEADWLAEFDLYRQSPEYLLRNAGMSLEAFKGIYWWEWVHRNWGRFMGLAFAVGFLWFWARGQIPKRHIPTMLGLFALGAAQGAMGWFMVMSGLVDRPSVSHYRLAMHLGLAMILFGLLISTALDLQDPAPRSGCDPDAPPLQRLAWLCLGLVSVTVVWGAFVAGLDAGFAYNTWPLMDGKLIPPEVAILDPWWINGLENMAAVQLVHRWLGVLSALSLLAFWLAVRASDLPSSGVRLAGLLALMGLVQVGLGISTLLTSVPVALGAAHQAGAFTLFGLLVWMLHELRPPSLAQD